MEVRVLTSRALSAIRKLLQQIIGVTFDLLKTRLRTRRKKKKTAQENQSQQF